MAQDRPTCGEPPSDAEVRERLTILESAVRDEEPAVRRWYSSFLLVQGTVALATGILAVTAEDDGFRVNQLFSAGGSAVGLLALLILAPPELGAGDELRSHEADTPDGRLRKMRAAEDVLRRAHDSIESARGWLPVTISVAYVAVASATLLLAFEQTTGAFLHSVGGVALALSRLLLRPTGARGAWRRYLARYPDAGCASAEPVATSPGPTLRVGPTGVGIGLSVSF